MSKLSRIFACVAIAAGLTLALSSGADARYRHHHYRGGWYGGFGPGFALGFGLGYGFGAPYYYGPRYGYYPRYYYYRPHCERVRVRVWRHGRWRWRSVRRCW
jgi:hypothetical protein